MNIGFQTPERKKSTSEALSQQLSSNTIDCTDSRWKHSSVSRRFGLLNDPIQQQKIDGWRESRLNSLFRVRRDRLEGITKENQKIYIKINTQESHYAYNNIRKVSPFQSALSSRVDNSEEKVLLGPIWEFKAPKLPTESAELRARSTKCISIRSFQKRYSKQVTISVKRSKQNLEPEPRKMSFKLPTANKGKIFYTQMRTKLPDIYPIQ